jgi:hypothetical protein
VNPALRYPSIDELITALLAHRRNVGAHLKANALLQLLAAPLHLGLTLLFAYHLFAGTPSSRSDSSVASVSSEALSVGDATLGFVVIVVLLASIAWIPLGIVWAPLNAWGLLRRKRWAAVSTLAYATLGALSCCGMPYAAYAWPSLMSRGTRKNLD